MWKKTAIIRLCKNLTGGKTEQVQGWEPVQKMPTQRYAEGALAGARKYVEQPTMITFTEDEPANGGEK